MPTLDEMSTDPSIFIDLPSEAQKALYAQVATLEARLRAEMLAGRARPTDASQPERLVFIDEAARMLATSEDTLYAKWRKLPFAFKDPLDNKIKFSVKGIERYRASRLGRNAP